VADRQEFIRDLFDRWNRGVREIQPGEIAPEAVVRSALTGGSYSGYEGIAEWMSEIDDQFDDWNVSIEEMEDLPDDRVLAIGQVHFRGRGSGVEFDQPIGWLLSFEDERIVEMANFSDHASARNAAAAPSS
jgi:ketosteroid isomerase-like protein